MGGVQVFGEAYKVLHDLELAHLLDPSATTALHKPALQPHSWLTVAPCPCTPASLHIFSLPEKPTFAPTPIIHFASPV